MVMDIGPVYGLGTHSCHLQKHRKSILEIQDGERTSEQEGNGIPWLLPALVVLRYLSFVVYQNMPYNPTVGVRGKGSHPNHGVNITMMMYTMVCEGYLAYILSGGGWGWRNL